MGRWSTRLSAHALVLAVVATSPARAQGDAAQPSPEQQFESWLATARDARGRSCDQRGVQVVGESFAAACGAAGVWLARRSATNGFTLVRTDELGGVVRGLFVGGGRLWAELERVEARPVALEGLSEATPETSSRAFPVAGAANTSEPSAPAEPPARPVAPPEHTRFSVLSGSVVEVHPGEVVIDLGRRHGIFEDEHIELAVLRTEAVGTEHASKRTVVAVGVVTAVSDRFARVRLGIDERVPLGALARPVRDELTAAHAAPPRAGGLWELSFMARPFLAIDVLGVGFLLDAQAGYRFEQPLHLSVGLAPLAYGGGEGRASTAPVSAWLQAGFDLPMFEVGFGGGLETMKQPSVDTPPGSGFLFLQHLRVGAVDGLNLDLQNHVVLFHQSFQFSSFLGSAQIPVGERSWLVFRGGGGAVGFGYGEMAVRVLLAGNGDRGSLFFSGSIGGAGVFETVTTTCVEPTFTYPCIQSVSYTGPLIGVGFEWRR